MATTKKTTAAKKAAPKKATPKKAAPKKTQKVQEPQHIGLVRDDSWVMASQHSRSLLLVICILDSINWLKVGCSVSGLPMLQRFT